MKLNKFVILCTMIGSILLMKLPMFSSNQIVRYTVPAAELPTVNPLKGWAPWVSEEEPVYPVSLIFVRIHWNEIEPEEGQYRFAELEKELHMDIWREKGVRFIIRIVCDTPDDEKHMDIPEWLYEKTYGDGIWYDSSYGKGYSPNYSNPTFIEEHRELIAAFGAYYAEDPQLGFVELGSLGHWGEWHVNSEAGIPQFPKAAVYNQYVQAYLDVFPAAKLLVRRPLTIAAEQGIGLYNDSFGVKSHEEWLEWINEGYVSSQSQETIGAMPEFWKVAPSGGEFATSQEEAYYFSKKFESTMEYIARSHTTFIGPRSGARITKKSLEDEILEASAKMGYCFQLSECTWKKNVWLSEYLLTLQIENLGVAPFYENWPMLVRIKNEMQDVVYEKEYDISLPELMPGKNEVKLFVDGVSFAPGQYVIEVEILDPLTGKAGIAFANESSSEVEYRYQVMSFTIK